MTLQESLNELGWSDNSAQEAVLQIMHYTGCFTEGGLPDGLLSEGEISAKLKEEMSLSDVNKVMQLYMLRKPGAERAMLMRDARYDCLETYYKQLGLLDEIKPTRKDYDAILLLGCSEPAFEERANTLKALFNASGISGPTYLLGSDRELWPVHEASLNMMILDRVSVDVDLNAEKLDRRLKEMLTAEVRGDAPLTVENEIAYLEQVRTDPSKLNKARAEINRYIREELKIAVPTEADMMNTVFETVCPDHDHTKVEAGKKSNGARANTEDTINKFLEVYPEKEINHILVISSQPVAHYQLEVTKTSLPANGKYIVDLAARGLEEKFNAAVIHDSLARIVFTTQERKKAMVVTGQGGIYETKDSGFVAKLNSQDTPQGVRR